MDKATSPKSFRRATRIGGVLVSIAALALIYEGASALQNAEWRIIPAGQLWFQLHTESLNLMQAVTQRYVHPFLWDPLIAGFLQWPLWSSLGGPGVALMLIFGRKGAA